jgi:hypothetical protein
VQKIGLGGGMCVYEGSWVGEGCSFLQTLGPLVVMDALNLDANTHSAA